MPQLLSDSDSEVEQRNQKQPQEDVDMSEEEDEEVGEDEYIVEEIKDHKFKGKVRYTSEAFPGECALLTVSPEPSITRQVEGV